jgi:membrane protease YdiL (CAAX protease family)/ABC-type multidrug transport system permease subunit
MFRVLWAIAHKSFSRGARLKTHMSKASLVFSCLFIAAFACYLISLFVMYFSKPVDIKEGGTILLVNSPASFDTFLAEDLDDTFLYPSFDLSYDDAYYDFAKYQDKLDSGEIMLVIVFPVDFEATMASLSGEVRPQIMTYYNPSNTNATNYRTFMIENVLADYGDSLQEKYGRIVTGSDCVQIISQPLDATYPQSDAYGWQSVASRMIIPFILFVTILYAVMESGVSCIAGEKERGTFAAILLTPVRRVEIVLGSALGILMYTMLPVMFLLLFLLPLTGLFTLSSFLSVTIICLSLAFLLTSLILIISIMNNSILSAQSSFLPVFFLMLIVCITAMQQQDLPSAVYYAIPFYGHYYGITAALTGQYDVLMMFIMLIGSAFFSFLLLFIAEKLLHMERFTTYVETEDAAAKEIRRKRNITAMHSRLTSFPENIVFGFRPVRYQSARRLLSRQLGLPATLLAVFQPLALLAPLLLFIKTSEATLLLNTFAQSSSGVSLTSAVSTSLSLFMKLMQSRLFVAGMSLSYVLIIAIYIILVRYVEKNPLSMIGLPLNGPHGIRRALFLYSRGLLIGLLMMFGVYLLLLVSGQIRISGFGLQTDQVSLFLIYILMWIPQGASEEIMLRGYMMPRLSARFGRAAAVGITSIYFSLLHIGNVGFSFISLLNLILIAIFFALFALISQEIWTVCAAHTMWNFAQGNLFGLEVSGTLSTARIVHTDYASNSQDLWTGGNFGPEGGLIVTVIIVVSLLILICARHTLGRAQKE